MDTVRQRMPVWGGEVAVALAPVNSSERRSRVRCVSKVAGVVRLLGTVEQGRIEREGSLGLVGGALEGTTCAGRAKVEGTVIRATPR